MPLRYFLVVHIIQLPSLIAVAVHGSRRCISIAADHEALTKLTCHRYPDIFQHPLPIVPDLHPSTSYTNTTTGKTIDFYEITIKAFDRQTYPNLGTTSYVGFVLARLFWELGVAY